MAHAARLTLSPTVAQNAGIEEEFRDLMPTVTQLYLCYLLHLPNNSGLGIIIFTLQRKKVERKETQCVSALESRLLNLSFQKASKIPSFTMS